MVEAPVEHPFFVYGKGWSAVNPEMSMSRYKLECHALIVGDVCASLTPKSALNMDPQNIQDTSNDFHANVQQSASNMASQILQSQINSR